MEDDAPRLCDSRKRFSAADMAMRAAYAAGSKDEPSFATLLAVRRFDAALFVWCDAAIRVCYVYFSFLFLLIKNEMTIDKPLLSLPC